MRGRIMKKNNAMAGLVFIIMFALAFITCDPIEGSIKDVLERAGGSTSYTVSFDSDGGSEVAVKTAAHGGKVQKPTDPKKTFALVEGLYLGSDPETYVLEGWYNGTKKWNFDSDVVTGDITLTAHWTEPVPIDISKRVEITKIDKAIGYAKDDPRTYTIAVGSDYSIMPQLLDIAGLKLTIIGLEEERKLSLLTVGTLFNVGANGQTGIELHLGKNITFMGRSANGSFPLVKVDHNAVLSMREGSKITGNVSAGNGSGIYIANGSFIMDGGSISNNTGVLGGGVYNAGSFTLNDGTISDNEGCGIYNTGIFNMEGGIVSDNLGMYEGYGGGVYTEGTFNLSGGEIKLNTADGKGAGGGGVYIRNGKFTMSGGTISKNISNGGSSGSFGAGVYIYGGTFTMNGGTISENRVEGSTTRSRNGGGVYNSDGEFIMNGGYIRSNTTLGSTYNNGGGVYTYSKCIINGGYIIDNTSLCGGGVSINGEFIMNGGYITGNTAEWNGIDVNYGNGGGVSVESASIFTLKEGTISGNTAQNKGSGVYAEGMFTMDGGKISNNASDGVYVESYIFSDPEYSNISGFFTMNNGEISDNEWEGVNVVLGTFTMSGGSILRNKGSGVYVDESGTFILNGGSTISDNSSTWGGGVYNKGAFTMNGGTISHNTASPRDGGGVYNVNTFNMYGGTITENSARWGDGVCVDDRYVESVSVPGTFTMHGGTISKNKGEGVYITDGGVFTLNNTGKISNNVGGVLVSDGYFYMNNGELMDNTGCYGGSDGGAVYVEYSGIMYMTGGRIYRNTATGYGGGVYISGFTDTVGAKFYKTGGTIEAYSPTNPDSNVVKDNSGLIKNNSGHAIYAREYNGSIIKRQETITAGPTVNLSFDATTKTATGNWQY